MKKQKFTSNELIITHHKQPKKDIDLQLGLSKPLQLFHREYNVLTLNNKMNPSDEWVS